MINALIKPTNALVLFLLLTISASAQAQLACKILFSSYTDRVLFSDGYRPVRSKGLDQWDLIYDKMKLQDKTLEFIRRRGERFPSGTHTYVLTLHGSGAPHSNINTFTTLQQLYNGSLTDRAYNPSYVHKNFIESFLKLSPNNEKYIEGSGSQARFSGVISESFPMPGLSKEVNYKDFKSLDEVMDYMVEMIAAIKSELPPGVRFVIHGRSSSSSFAAELAYRYPKIADAFVLMSMPFPQKDMLEENFQRMDEVAKKDNYGELLWPWIHWAKDRILESTWVRSPEKLGDARIMFLLGSADNEMLPRERKAIEEVSMLSENTFFLMIPGAGHEVTKLDANSKRTKREGASNVAQFLDLLLNKVL
tara:strand:+ start:1243 stop:2331 length:1089 start_codon:yes stop_codon:yes gene_type:complete